MGILYIVGTPIGNLEDITLRAIKILSNTDIILAEDTRVTHKLLEFVRDYNAGKSNDNKINSLAEKTFVGQQSLLPKLISYHQHSAFNKKLEILNYLIQGKNLALVTDAGTPGVQDPGNELISFLLEKLPELKIVPVPGASAITSALSVCGFNANKFVFLGFLGKKGNSKHFEEIKSTGKGTFVFFESPHRILKTLKLVAEIFDDKVQVFVGRELTKLYEKIYRGEPLKVFDELSKDTLKGEIVVVISF
jgi:16S rRNA (cytidine1402-2'-O)-methyltransferase